MIIKTEEDWWELTEKIWPDIIEIFWNVGAPMDERYFIEDLNSNEMVIHDHPLAVILENLRRDRNGKELSSWFNKAWFAAPDKSYIHGWNNWYNFCDLCSENWVFYEEC